MLNRSGRWASMVAVLLAAACQPVEETAPAHTMQDAEAAFETVRSEWTALSEADDAAGVAALYTADAIFVDAFGNEYRGREAIQGYFEESFAAAHGIVIERRDMAMSGDGVSAYGVFSQTVAGPDGEAEMVGHWQTYSVWEADGSLLIREHLSMIPAPPPPGM